MDDGYNKEDVLAQEVNSDSNQYSDSPPISWIEPGHSGISKSLGWYVIFGIIITAVITLDILLLKYYTLSAVVLVSAVALVIYYKKPFSEISYTISPDKGIYINQTLHPYEEFKSFGVVQEGLLYRLVLIPTKRFGQSLSIHIPEQLGEQIVDTIGNQLPMQEMKTDAIDRIIRKIGL